VPIVSTVALDGRGIGELARACEEHLAHLRSEAGAPRRARQRREALELLVRERLLVRASELLEARREDWLARAEQGEDPYVVAEEILAQLLRAPCGQRKG
jgi:putative protein kinase ArgK-like GTPase of G3E family